MPWMESTRVRERMQFVVLALAHVQSFSALCAQFGIARKTGYKWLARYAEAQSVADLADRARIPAHTPNRTPPEVEARAVALRRQYGWGARKLQVLLEREGITLSEATLNRVIQRNGLLGRADVRGHATRRFERCLPNDLWQTDFKGPIQLARAGERCVPLAILDDHSRFLVGLYALPSTHAQPVRAVLRQSFQAYGLPREILTDHGTPFWSTSNVHGLTNVAVDILNQQVTLLHGAVRHPQTQGKVERLNRTLQEALRHRGTPRTLPACQAFFDEFRVQYNTERPHEALGMAVPASRYTPSVRAFQAEPLPWGYDANMTVRRLNTQGCLDYGGQRLFVSEALAEQPVGTLVLEGQLIVQFRDMLIREIQLDSRRGRALKG